MPRWTLSRHKTMIAHAFSCPPSAPGFSSWGNGTMNYDLVVSIFNSSHTPDLSDVMGLYKPSKEDLKNYSIPSKEFLRTCSYDRRPCSYKWVFEGVGRDSVGLSIRIVIVIMHLLKGCLHLSVLLEDVIFQIFQLDFFVHILCTFSCVLLYRRQPTDNQLNRQWADLPLLFKSTAAYARFQSWSSLPLAIYTDMRFLVTLITLLLSFVSKDK